MSHAKKVRRQNRIILILAVAIIIMLGLIVYEYFYPDSTSLMEIIFDYTLDVYDFIFKGVN